MRTRRSLLGALLVGLLVAVVPAAPGQAGRDAAAPFPGGPYFVVGCGFSHRNHDDPIVYPGEPGRSHDHTFIGNRSTDASSTPATLRGGETTCGDEGDSSAYWVPTLFSRGNAVRPLVGLAYYVRRTAGPVEAFPAGLKVVAGNAHARRAQALGIVSWSCGSLARRFAVVPACGRNQVVELRVQFPNCWNGRTLDSADHKRHMAYAAGGRCPATHPVAVPTILLLVVYPPVDRRSAQVSAGRFGAHADFINGWDQDALRPLVEALN